MVLKIAERMKRYESVTDIRLTDRLPILVRCDGKSFHTLTKALKFSKPFDCAFSECMTAAATFAASQMQGCMLSYTQSDEITFVVRTDQSDETTPWFDNRILKMASVTASLVTAAFNRELSRVLGSEPGKGPCASFDCRLHPVPDMTEVVNNLIWRQQDCVKNSISSATYYEVSKKVGRGTARKMMQGLCGNEQQELLFRETGINWNDYDPKFKRGIVVFRKGVMVDTEHGPVERKRWLNEGAQIFTSEDGRKWLTETLAVSKEACHADSSPLAVEPRLLEMLLNSCDGVVDGVRAELKALGLVAAKEDRDEE
jgi:tRNA(His) 5'-end guanylyltransferase